MSKCEICQKEMEKEQAQYVSGKLICKECADIEETKKTREKEEYENGILRDTGLTRKQVN